MTGTANRTIDRIAEAGASASGGLLVAHRNLSDASYSELFFDLVFVFSLIAVSRSAGEILTGVGLVRIVLLVLALWWFWINSVWTLNVLNPGHRLVIFWLLGMTFGGLVLGTSVAGAFTQTAGVFASAYVLLQVGRTLLVLAALRSAGSTLYLDAVRMVAWFGASGVLWISGAWWGGSSQLALWAAALAIEYAAPLAGYRLPGMGSTDLAAWQINGEAFARRCAQFVIIALGEVIIALGLVFDIAHAGWAAWLALASGFAICGAAWWLSFYWDVEKGLIHISQSANPGIWGRNTYTYFQAPIVLGIVLTAVGLEMTIAEPSRPPSIWEKLALLAGPAVFLGGSTLFKWSNSDWKNLPVSHLVGIAALCLVGAVGTGIGFGVVVLCVVVAFVLAATALWEARMQA